MFYVSIDYSITSPSVCLFNNNSPFSFESCRFLVMRNHSNKNRISKTTFPENIEFVDSVAKIDTDSNIKRYTQNAESVMNWLKSNIQDEVKIVLEGYSMGAKGLTFNIGEATGIFKSMCYQNGWETSDISPSSIKKFATGKGNSNKFSMLEAFELSVYDGNRPEWISNFITEKEIKAPITDIVDSFFLNKMISKAFSNE